MPNKRRATTPKYEKQRKLGLYLLQVVKATNDGAPLPITQDDVRKLLKKNHRVNIPNSTSSVYVSLLTDDKLFGRIWLRQDGHNISLFSEEETLADSQAIEALFVAHSLIDGNDRVAIPDWVDKCVKRLKITPEDCNGFLQEFITCSYASFSDDDPGSVIELDVRAFSEDGFYLRLARYAKLTKRVSRRKKAKK